MPRLPRWFGALLAPAEDPRRWQSGPASSVEGLLAELRRARAELAELGQHVDPHLADELAEAEQELWQAERSLQLALDERRVRQALLRAAELLSR